jgi:hypothetical protein
MYRIFPAQTLGKFRNRTRLEIEGEKFHEFLDTEWARSRCDTLKE